MTILMNEAKFAKSDIFLLHCDTQQYFSTLRSFLIIYVFVKEMGHEIKKTFLDF